MYYSEVDSTGRNYTIWTGHHHYQKGKKKVECKKEMLTQSEQTSVPELNASTALWSSCSKCFQD